MARTVTEEQVDQLWELVGELEHLTDRLENASERALQGRKLISDREQEDHGR